MESRKKQKIILFENEVLLLPAVCYGFWSFSKYLYICLLYTTSVQSEIIFSLRLFPQGCYGHCVRVESSLACHSGAFKCDIRVWVFERDVSFPICEKDLCACHDTSCAALGKWLLCYHWAWSVLPAASKLCSKLSLDSVPSNAADLQWQISKLNLLIFNKAKAKLWIVSLFAFVLKTSTGKVFSVIALFENDVEITLYKCGGSLNFVARRFL